MWQLVCLYELVQSADHATLKESKVQCFVTFAANLLAAEMVIHLVVLLVKECTWTKEFPLQNLCMAHEV